jgi:hypothetical protein
LRRQALPGKIAGIATIGEVPVLTRLTKILAAVAVFTGTIASTAPRAEAPDLTLQPSGRFVYGEVGNVIATLTYRGDACPAAGLPPPMKGTLELFVDNVRVQSGLTFYSAFYRSCRDGIYTAGKDLSLWFLGIGPHTIRLSYTGEPGIEAAQSDPVEVTVRPGYTGTVPGMGGSIGLGISSLKEPGFGLNCSAPHLQRAIDFSSTPGAPPPSADFRYGFVNFSVGCTYECGFLCPQLPPIRVEQRMQLEYPEPLPPGSTIWAYTPSADNPNPSWKPLPTSIDGRLATVTVQGGFIGGAPIVDNLLRGSLGLAVPAGTDFAYNVQDMWWGGPGEDGWGATIAQVRNRITMNLLVYDSEGRPAWYLLRDSTWDPARQQFAGALYRPDARRMGPPVGSTTLSFSDPDHGTLTYEVNGQRGTKAIERLAFGPSTAQVDPHAGFWELTAAGTGAMSINKRGEALFISWLEFPGGGPGRWLVAPEGRWTSANTFEAALFSTSSSAWAGTDYDASELRLRAVGTLSLTYTGADQGEISYTIDGVTFTSPVRRSLF